MQLSIPFVSILLLTSSSVLGGPLNANRETGVPIALERRNMLVTTGGHVKMAALNKHFKAINSKYAKAMDNYHRNTGQVHPLKAKSKKTNESKKSKRRYSSQKDGWDDSGSSGDSDGSGSSSGAGSSGSHPDTGDSGGSGSGTGTGSGSGSDSGSGGSGSGGSSGSDGSVDLEDVGHQQLWAGPVTFGGQKFSLDFDTGSADTLVNPDAYDPSKSETSKSTKKSFRTAYGDGTAASGTVYMDVMEIGGLKAEKVAIGRSDQQFIDQSQSPSQGIGGLSFPSIQAFPEGCSPFFDTIRKQNTVSQGVFQFTLRPGSGSELHIGGIDQSKASGEFQYANVDPSKGFWVTDASINGQSITAIVDSGTTIIMGPMDEVESVVRGIHGVIPTNQQGMTAYMYDCGQTPDITITIAGLDVKLNEDQVRFGESNGQCVLPIMGQNDMPMHAWIVGDTLFQATTIIFDVDQNRLGIALQT